MHQPPEPPWFLRHCKCPLLCCCVFWLHQTSRCNPCNSVCFRSRCTFYTHAFPIVSYHSSTMPSLQTLTSHSSILWVAISTVDRRASRTVNQVVFTASAANIIQVDCASASTKMGSNECYCICWKQFLRNWLHAYSLLYSWKDAANLKCKLFCCIVWKRMPLNVLHLLSF